MEHFPEFVANNLFLFSLLVAILALLAWNLFGASAGGIPQVAPGELTRLMNHENAMLLDVRSAEDFNEGHIINAINMPVAESDNRPKKLDRHKQKPVILYCNNGMDSVRVGRTLKKDGFENLSILKGGLQSWRNANLPVTRDQSGKQSA